MVKYRSTRGQVRHLSFEEAVLTGLASDRGLIVPEENDFPTLPPNALEEWSHLTYPELAVHVMSLFIDPTDIPRDDLKTLVNKSYNASTFRDASITPVVPVTERLHVLELYHGPTFAFKDIALQFLGNLFEYFIERKNKKRLAEGKEPYRVTVVGATSGDTGSSAIYGLRGKKNIEAFIMFPQGRVSAIQERQMTTVLDENIHNIALKGTFDDCQAIVKSLFADAAFKTKYNLGAVNSINWARILAQIVYYVYGYLQLANQGFKNISFSVPTGNFGDVLAGFYARKLGVRIHDLIVATNENDILHRFFSGGTYERHPILHTTTPSMDICVSSNFERYLFALCDENPQLLAQWMATFEQTGKLTLPHEYISKAEKEMKSYSVMQNAVSETIAKHYNKKGYLLDPHTAVAVAAAEAFLRTDETASVIVVGTAHYGKFLPTVCNALELKETAITQHPILQALNNMPTSMAVQDNSTQKIKAFIESNIGENKEEERQPIMELWKNYRPSDAIVSASIAVAAVATAFILSKRGS